MVVGKAPCGRAQATTSRLKCLWHVEHGCAMWKVAAPRKKENPTIRFHTNDKGSLLWFS